MKADGREITGPERARTPASSRSRTRSVACAPSPSGRWATWPGRHQGHQHPGDLDRADQQLHAGDVGHAQQGDAVPRLDVPHHRRQRRDAELPRHHHEDGRHQQGRRRARREGHVCRRRRDRSPPSSRWTWCPTSSTGPSSSWSTCRCAYDDDEGEIHEKEDLVFRPGDTTKTWRVPIADEAKTGYTSLVTYFLAAGERADGPSGPTDETTHVRVPRAPHRVRPGHAPARRTLRLHRRDLGLPRPPRPRAVVLPPQCAAPDDGEGRARAGRCRRSCCWR